MCQFEKYHAEYAASAEKIFLYQTLRAQRSLREIKLRLTTTPPS